MKLTEEGRLLLRLGHLRKLRCYTHDDRIVFTLNEFIAETETRLVTTKPDRTRKATLH